MTTKPDDLQRLLAEEPFVRALAHSLVADEADDVVQQAFLRALERRPAELVQPRGWLARVVRNLVADRRRALERADARHRTATFSDRVPSSSDLLEGEERRRSLVAAVDHLPPDQRTVVLLRYYDGLPPRRIATELGLPVTTVSNRLHDALQTLRVRLDAEHGDRRAWLLPLVPFATSPRALPWHDLAAPATNTLLGAIVMTTKTKIVAAVAALLVLALAWAVWPTDGNPASRSPDAGTANASIATADMQPHKPVELTAPRREEVAPVSKPAATTGVLLVHVRYADEPTVAAGLTVLVAPNGADYSVGVHRAVTDAVGTARFAGLMPGSVRAHTTVQPGLRMPAEIAAGATSECTVQLAGGMTLNGIVVDAAGVPVGGALVEGTLGGGYRGVDADQIAITSTDGTFSVRQCETICLVGARAAGHAASQMYSRIGKPGAVEHVRIELRADGGAVEGVVLGPSGQPVVAAIVRVGEGKTTDIRSTPQGAPPLPAQVRTDAAGRFVAIGVPAGTQPVGVRAVGMAPWLGTCEVAAGMTVPLRVVMSEAVTCTGIVRAEDGEPAPDVDVSFGNRGDFVLRPTRTSADGSFTLTGLPVGEFVLTAGKERLGKATARLHGQSGETVRCELRLSNGLALRGRVLDDQGAPLEWAEIHCETEDTGARWNKGANTDKEGRFLVADCPPGRRLTVRATKRDHLFVQRNAVEPGAGELELRVARDLAPKARLTGRLLRPDGTAAVGETVDMASPPTPSQPQMHATGKVQSDGGFAIEMRAGTWQGRVQVTNHPEIRLASRTLAAGEAWDVGTLQLTVGGTLVVRDSGQPQLEYLVVDSHERFVCGLHSPVPPLRSGLLAPGDYVLLADASGIAAQALPFTIRSEQETQLEIQRPAGVRQRLEFVLADGTGLQRNVAFEIRRDGKLLLWGSTEVQRTGSLTSEAWLAPGGYTLATRDQQPASSAWFTVGSAERPPVRVTVR